MIGRAWRRCALPLAATAALCLAACRADSPAPIVQPGAPGEPGRVISAPQAADLSRIPYTAADVRFMQQMYAHHAQAVEMTALIPARTSRDAMRLLGRRIEISQADEMLMMAGWLRARGADVPGPHAHHGEPMPGMLTADEMERLAAARGDEFDRLFLELMIKHHEGALTMVDELFAADGAAQQSDVFAFAADVDADQRMEIDRMSAMLQERQR